MTPRGLLVRGQDADRHEPARYALTRVSRTDAMSGPGASSPRSSAITPRACAGVISCSGGAPLAASCSSSAVVAWSSAIVTVPSPVLDSSADRVKPW